MNFTQIRRILMVAVVAISLQSCQEKTITIENNTVEIPKDLKINQIQVIGTHNSYAKKRDAVIMDFVDPILTNLFQNYAKSIDPEGQGKWNEFHPNLNELTFKEMISYSFPDFKAQLNAGLRSLAIDIVYDPVGGTFSKPAVYEAMKAKGITNYQPFDATGLETPGFKVMHMPDVDFLSHYNTFEAALTDLKTWSDKNPTHAPVYIMIEAKDKGFPIFPNSAKVTPFSSDIYDALDQTLVAILGREKIIAPDDVRGDYKTLNEAVLNKNWPTVQASQGKFIFLLLPGGAGLTSESAYVKNHESLKDRIMFVKANAGEAHAGFLLLDNAIVRQNDIQQYVKQGYMVRTRSDIETYEAKVNDYSRAKAAFKSGAQVISTDYYQDTNNYGTSYKVELPSNKPIQVNPLNASL